MSVPVPVRSVLGVLLGASLAHGGVCPGNVITNGDFTAGVVPGSMPSGSVTGWSLASNTPQVLPDGCDDSGSLLMWGNRVVGESVVQAAGAGTFQFGKTYRITVCMRRYFNNPLLPEYVRFRFRASNGFVPFYNAPAGPGLADIGATPYTSSTDWQTFTLPDWTADGDYDTLTINPENEFTVNDGNFVSWGQLDNVCIVEVEDPCVTGDLVANGGFTAGLVYGSMPAPGSVANWSLLTNTPQVVDTAGCQDIGYVQMWGNQVVGESIQQLLPGAGIVKGKTYRVTLCYRWHFSAPNPAYVRFRVAASSSPSLYPPTDAAADVIGITGDSTSSTSWSLVTFPNWTAPKNATHLTINPENDSTANDGAFVSWGHVDNICIVEVPPCKTPVLNGGFTEGLVYGSMPSPGMVANWTAASASPQVVDTMGCEDVGYIQMWGNQVVGESIQQSVTFKKNHTYRTELCYRWLSSAPNPAYVRMRLSASIGAKTYGACPPATCSTIGVTPNTSSTSWLPLTLADWVAPKTFDTLTINPENDSILNDGAFVSWGHVDDVCITDVSRCRWVEIGAGLPGITGIPKLVGTNCVSAGNLITLEVSNAAPLGLALFVVGISEANYPFSGGVLTPALDVVFPVLPLGASGSLALPAAVPAAVVPPDLELYFQAVIGDPSAPFGIAMTNALFTVTG